jgi:hypothetical protein
MMEEWVRTFALTGRDFGPELDKSKTTMREASRQPTAPVGPERLVLRGVRRLRRLQPAVNLFLQLGLPLANALVAHRLVLGRIRLDLGAVERHVPELHQSGPLAQFEHLHEQRRERSKMAASELRDGAKVLL